MGKKTTLFGAHIIENLMMNQPARILQVFILKEKITVFANTIIKSAKVHHIPVEYVTQVTLEKLTGGGNHQGVAALCESYIFNEEAIPGLLANVQNPFILILDGIQDPHNLGACFRSAEAAGVNFIISPKDKSVGLTPIVSKVASGAAENVPFVQVTNLVRTLELLKKAGVWIYGAAHEATKQLYDVTFPPRTALVMGAEGEGLRRLTREHCDELLAIPMVGTVGSLNVSVATGIFLFEVVRQRARH